MASVAVTSFLFVVGFCGINALLLLAFGLKHLFFDTGDPIRNRYGETLVAQVYPGLPSDELNELLLETWGYGFTFDPFSHFKEVPRKGKWVNVDPNGFRVSTNQGPWPIAKTNFNIFVFGGSTTFNYGVKDSETICSRLQEALISRGLKLARVYNFGRGDYYSSQERVLFEKLLLKGHHPNLAIFIDGLNEFTRLEDEPKYTKEFTVLLERQNLKKTAWGLLNKNVNDFLQFVAYLPLTRAAAFILEKFGWRNDSPLPSREIVENTVPQLIARFEGNRALIRAAAKVHNVKTLFILQPIPFFDYDLSFHPFIREKTSALEKLAVFSLERGYSTLHRTRQRDLLSLSAIQEDIKKPLYIDAVHYSAEMSQMLADKIAKHITP